MVGDFSIKCKYRDAILNQIKKEINPSENDLMLMRDRLNKATPDELERTYEAFERFGVKIVMDLVRQWKIVFIWKWGDYLETIWIYKFEDGT